MKLIIWHLDQLVEGRHTRSDSKSEPLIIRQTLLGFGIVFFHEIRHHREPSDQFFDFWIFAIFCRDMMSEAMSNAHKGTEISSNFVCNQACQNPEIYSFGNVLYLLVNDMLFGRFREVTELQLEQNSQILLYITHANHSSEPDISLIINKVGDLVIIEVMLRSHWFVHTVLLHVDRSSKQALA